MKKLIALFLLICLPANAAPDCQQLPDCEAYGYTCSADDCSGLKTLSCPFDESKKICWPEAKECEVGSLLFDDLKCYDAACGREPIAIVVNTDERVALQLATPVSKVWSPLIVDVNGADDNCETKIATQTALCRTDGKLNTKEIMEFAKANPEHSFPAVEYCYTLTFGNQPEGSWYLPSFKELYYVVENYPLIANIFTLRGLTFTNRYWWTSTEYNETFAHWLNPTNGLCMQHNYSSSKSNSCSTTCMIRY